MTKKLLCLCLAVLILLGIAGCQRRPEDTVIHTIEFSEKFLNIAQQTPQEWVEDLKVTAQGELEDVYVDEARGSVILKLADSHMPHWTKQMDSLLTQLRTDFSGIDDRYRLEYSEDYTNIDLYYNLDLPALEAVSYILHTELYCIFQQLLAGCGADGWVVAIQVYNCDTGKLVASGGSDSMLTYTKEDWEASK